MKIKNRSPYAKSLELKQYRHRVQERKKVDFDDWVEDALEEYWNGREEIQEGEIPEEDKGTGREENQNSSTTGESTTQVVEIHQEQTQREGNTETK